MPQDQVFGNLETVERGEDGTDGSSGTNQHGNSCGYGGMEGLGGEYTGEGK